MATEAQINAVTDIIISVFGSDQGAFTAALTRIKLHAELAEIDSNLRNVQAAQAKDDAGYLATITDLNNQRVAKQAEIDKL